MAHSKTIQTMSVIAEFDERELTRRCRKGAKYSIRPRRSQTAPSAKNIRKPNLRRTSSLPSKLETSPETQSTRKLFWFRPSPELSSQLLTDCEIPKEKLLKREPQFLEPCLEIEECHEEEEDLIGLKFL